MTGLRAVVVAAVSAVLVLGARSLGVPRGWLGPYFDGMAVGLTLCVAWSATATAAAVKARRRAATRAEVMQGLRPATHRIADLFPDVTLRRRHADALVCLVQRLREALGEDAFEALVPDTERAALVRLRYLAPHYGPIPAPADASHPESYCHRCGGPNRSWAAPSPLWNAVMRQGDNWLWDEIICPTCFAVLAELAGVAHDWRLDATPLVELPTTSPDGRVWDPVAWLWRLPGEASTDVSRCRHTDHRGAGATRQGQIARTAWEPCPSDGAR